MKINIKSDFKILIEITNKLGERIDPLSIDFIFNYFSYNNKEIKYTISNINNVQTNCKEFNGKLMLIFENHKFNSFKIKEERHFFLQDEDFKDKIYDIYIDNILDFNNYNFSNYYFSNESEKIIIPYIIGESAYDSALKGGYVGEKEDFYLLLGKKSLSYEELKNKPSINNIELSNNKSLLELGIEPIIEKKTAFNKDFGTTKNTIVEGNDIRLSDSRSANDVYDWAKAKEKPKYTYEEVGAQIKGNYITDLNYIHTDNNFTNQFKEKLNSLSNYDDTIIKETTNRLIEVLENIINGNFNGIIDSFKEVETFLLGIADSETLLKMLIDLKSSILGGATDNINTLNKIYNVLLEKINKKVDQEENKQLSTENYTTDEKNKLITLENYNDTILKKEINDLKEVINELPTKEYVDNIVGNINIVLTQINGR